MKTEISILTFFTAVTLWQCRLLQSATSIYILDKSGKKVNTCGKNFLSVFVETGWRVGWRPWGVPPLVNFGKDGVKMDFPKNEVQAVLVWMREQMYGEVTTEWTYGNEHDRMYEAADLLRNLLSRHGDELEM